MPPSSRGIGHRDRASVFANGRLHDDEHGSLYRKTKSFESSIDQGAGRSSLLVSFAGLVRPTPLARPFGLLDHLDRTAQGALRASLDKCSIRSVARARGGAALPAGRPRLASPSRGLDASTIAVGLSLATQAVGRILRHLLAPPGDQPLLVPLANVSGADGAATLSARWR
jgi:hypothetical protein